ncbi:MAG: tetratricopeptide repeat protein [Hyphomicrobiaceae bacterium]
MARDWRRAVLTVFAAAMLGGACAPDAFAQSADKDEAQAETKAGTKARKKQDPAEAQRVIESALKQLQAGNAEQAVQAVSATVAGGNLPPAVLAKALYVRGAAHRRQGRPAQAISDLTSALWLRGGLGGDEREEAVKEKAQAYADVGLADPGEGRAPKTKTKSTDSGSNWLTGLFGGGSPPEPPSPPPAPKVSAVTAERVEPPPSPAPKASAPKAVGAAWASKTEVVETPPSAPPPKARPPKTAKATPRPAPSAKKAQGRHLVQLAAKRTEAEALALAAKAKREHASLLGSRGQSVDRAVFGNMGAFYCVRFGPFASAQETQSVCSKLRGSGIDCLPVNR